MGSGAGVLEVVARVRGDGRGEWEGNGRRTSALAPVGGSSG